MPRKNAFPVADCNLLMEQDLFRTDPGKRWKQKRNDSDVLLAHLEPYPNHPFRLYNADKLEDLAESIRRHGILNRLIVRKNDKTGGYIILAGHNRAAAAKLAGLEEVPVCVVEVDDDTAAMIVTDSNLQQREKLFPSEKARAYKIQMDVLKKQGRRTDLEAATFGTAYQKHDARQSVAERNNESSRNVGLYLRLLKLTPALLELVDSERIPVQGGVELSYLPLEEQESLLPLIPLEGPRLRVDAASAIRSLSKDALFTVEAVKKLIAGDTIEILKPTPEKNPQAKKNIQPFDPYRGVIKNLSSFLSRLPVRADLIDWDVLQAIIIKAVEEYIGQKSEDAG